MNFYQITINRVSEFVTIAYVYIGLTLSKKDKKTTTKI